MKNPIRVDRTTYADIETMRELYRYEAHCQIVGDSLLRRGLADAYLFLVNGRRAGYGGVRNQYGPGRIMEFYVLPPVRARDAALPAQIGRAFLQASGATHVEAQTNLSSLHDLLLELMNTEGEDDAPSPVEVEKFLFADDHSTSLQPPVLKPGSPCVFRSLEEENAWGIEGDAGDGKGWRLLASGGFLTHYNPPYADIYMEVEEAARRKGVGAYLVQELKGVCYEAGYLPTCRCNVDNTASRKTLEKAGFGVCGQIVSGRVGRLRE